MSKILTDNEGQGNPRAASVRIRSISEGKYKGQRRHDLRIGWQPRYVDAERVVLNRILMEPPAPAMMRKIAIERRDLRKTQRTMKSNAAIATAGIITFGSEAAQMFEKLPPDQQDAAFKDLAQEVADRLNTSLHSLVVHLDEATIHTHFILSSHDREGIPLSQSTAPRVLSGLQDLTAEVMQRYCPDIERGHRYGDRIKAGAKYADTINKSVRELHRTLPADLAKKRGELTDLTQAETAAKIRVDEMQGRVERLEAKRDLTAKETKRLETYQRRLTDRLGELKTAQTASEAAKTEADRLTQIARADRQTEQKKAAQVAAKSKAVRDAVSTLSEEVIAGTIHRSSAGKIKAKAPEILKLGYPEIGPAIRAAADFITDMDAARKKLAKERSEIEAQKIELAQARREISEEWSRNNTLKLALRKALAHVARWLNHPDLARNMREEGIDLVSRSKPLLPPADDPPENTGPRL